MEKAFSRLKHFDQNVYLGQWPKCIDGCVFFLRCFVHFSLFYFVNYNGILSAIHKNDDHLQQNVKAIITLHVAN